MNIINSERLREAAIYAWNNAKDQYNGKTAWKPGESRKLPLIKLYPSIRDFQPDAAPTSQLDYYCYVSYDRIMIDIKWQHRILITAPQFDPTFQYVAETWETSL